MIVVDIETSGGDWNKCGIWQIGAVELENPENTFLEEGRIDDEDEVNSDALIICGKTEEELRDKSKQSQEQLIKNFLKWIKNLENRDLICHNPQFDQSFIKTKAIKYWKTDPFFEDNTHRVFDTHTIAQIKFLELNNKFLTKEHHSGMGLRNVLKLCGIKDTRRSVKEGEVSEGDPHNALEDAKLTAECFSRLINGKNLFQEYAKFEIPRELVK